MIALIIKMFFFNVTFSIETLMKQIKLVVTEKHQFDNRYESFLIAFLGTFRPTET